METGKKLTEVLRVCGHDRIFVLTDENTRRHCLPLLHDCQEIREAPCLTLPPGDDHKDIQSLSLIWQFLSEHHATRHSLLINLGGGVVTDMGGFAAATFKRGIRFINIPTTLLAMVDAAEGGKTGINFMGLKNEIGCFQPALEVVTDVTFLKTLDRKNLYSGYAEMLKHSLLTNEDTWAELLTLHLEDIQVKELQPLVEKSIDIKRAIVKKDPTEKGIRKALNLGHTAGHALESLAMEKGKPVLHGYAVAWGLVCELYLSCKYDTFPQRQMLQTAQFIKEHYGTFVFDCKQYDTLYELMTHDKKNTGKDDSKVNFTLLGGFGEIHVDRLTNKKEIEDMLDFFRETMGC